MKLSDLLPNFFTHKDFLPAPNTIPGTMFTPLHLLFAALVLSTVIALSLFLSRKSAKTVRRTFTALWVSLVILEIAKIVWETVSGHSVNFEWGGMLPLYPCSVFMYAMPFAIWGRGLVRQAACGYVCSVGLLGGAINFVYPATILGSYSCISFAGFHTFYYHGTMLLCAVVMLLSHYHSYRATRPRDLLLPALPLLCVSLIANAVNFSPIGSDYMFFRLNSFLFAPIGRATPDWLSLLLVYAVYLLAHALPYLPSYIKHAKKGGESFTLKK